MQKLKCFSSVLRVDSPYILKIVLSAEILVRNVTIYVDGYFYKQEGRVQFVQKRAPNLSEIEKVLSRLVKKVIRYLKKNSYLEIDGSDLSINENLIGDLHESSVTYRIAVGPRAGQKIQIVGANEKEGAKYSSGGGVNLNGFNIHAGVSVKGHQREKLKALCRYIARGPLAKERVEKLCSDKISIRFKKPWSNGATHVVYSNIEFIEKLVALVPPKRANLLRYHGAFAPASPLRKEVCPTKEKGKKEQEIKSNYRLPWAELLKRTFNVDGEKCNNCGGKLKPIAIVVNHNTAQRILTSIKIKSKLVSTPSCSKRGPPGGEGHPIEDYSQLPLDW